MIAFCLTPTYARTRVIDFVVAFGESPLAAMIPPPTEDGKIIAVIKPYKIEVIASPYKLFCYQGFIFF